MLQHCHCCGAPIHLCQELRQSLRCCPFGVSLGDQLRQQNANENPMGWWFAKHVDVETQRNSSLRIESKYKQIPAGGHEDTIASTSPKMERKRTYTHEEAAKNGSGWRQHASARRAETLQRFSIWGHHCCSVCLKTSTPLLIQVGELNFVPMTWPDQEDVTSKLTWGTKLQVQVPPKAWKQISAPPLSDGPNSPTWPSQSSSTQKRKATSEFVSWNSWKDDPAKWLIDQNHSWWHPPSSGEKLLFPATFKAH